MTLSSFAVSPHRLVVAAGLTLAALAAGPAAAEWPERPVTIVVPYGPGASNDILARAVADYLSKKFGQPFLIDNRPGAGGFVGSGIVVKAEPDGYTLLEHNSSITGIGPGQKLDFDPDRDLTAIAMLGRSPNAVLTSPVHGIDTVEKLIERSKANPEETFYGVSGIGNSGHLHIERLLNAMGVTMKPVVYPSAAQMQTDLVAGRVHMLVNTVTAAQGQIESGQINLIGYTDTGASPDAPKAKTMQELGVDYTYSVWWGIWGPAGMDKDLTDRINAAINEAVQNPAFIALLSKSGASADLQTAEEFRATVKSETDMFVRMLQDTKTGQ